MSKDFSETVALELGPAIAKGIAKLWLAETPLLSHATAGVIDVVQAFVKDRSKHPKGTRLLEEIGERVAEELKRFIELEAPALDDASRNAVAIAVSHAIGGANLSATSLVRVNVDPTKIAALLSQNREHLTRHFQVDETSLFDLSIQEISRQLTEVATQLPAFTERAFGEVLSRQSQITANVERILQELRRIREETVSGSSAERDRFEIEYRRVASSIFDSMELIGVDLPLAAQRYKLSVAYVALNVQRKLVTPARAIGKSQRKPPRPVESAVEEAVAAPPTAVELILADSPRLLLRGLAGHGKTTLLRWITVQTCARRHSGKLEAWNQKIPFFVGLRHCRSGLPKPQELADLTVPSIAVQQPEGWCIEKLREGRAILLIDGVDEIPKQDRQRLRDWVNELVVAYPNNIYIVTTRPSAVPDGWLADIKFLEGELQPMGVPEISACIDHWYRAVWEQCTEEEMKEAQEQARRLQKRVSETSSIRNLATSPLLCAMLCALNRDRQEQLPRDRIELYEAACSLLIQRRDIERKIDLSPYPQLTYRQKLALLQDIAYWFVKNGWSEVPADNLDQRLGERISFFRGLDRKVTGQDLRTYLVERSGILREPVIGAVDFTHKTFQEFLAAKQIAEERDTGLLLKNATEDQWREVVILAAGICTVEDQEEILGTLIRKGDEEKPLKHQYHLLAVACLETTSQLSPTVEREIVKRLAKLIPPKSISEAKDLASAGDLAVPYLSYKSTYKAIEAASCVRALSLIGGDAALDKISQFAGEHRQTVINELFKAWHSFDSYSFGEKVLAAMKGKPGFLAVDRLTSIDGVQFLRGVQTLELNNLRGIADFGPLGRVAELRKLGLNSLQGVDRIDRFGRCENLQDIEISDSSLKDLSALKDLKKLTRLELTGLPWMSDISSLAALRTLERLELTSVPVKDLSPLARLPKLSFLDLTACHALENLDSLEPCPSVSTFFLFSCPRLSDLGGLRNLRNVQRVDIHDCGGLRDLSVLGEMDRLRVLRIRRMPAIENFAFLKNAEKRALRELWLHAADKEYLEAVGKLGLELEVQIFDLDKDTSLSPFVYRTRLSLYSPESLQPLKGLPKLTSLRIEAPTYSAATEYGILAELPNLEVLELERAHNHGDLRSIKSIKKLKELRLQGYFHAYNVSFLRDIPKLARLIVPKSLASISNELKAIARSVEFLD
jgi:hypothetical protein